MQSSLWSMIDPAAEFRVAPSGYDQGAADPSRQTVGVKSSWFSPENGNFGFLVVATGVVVGLYYVFEHGGVGAGANAHVGPAHGDAEAGIGGK
jgi:hypothetical protein